MSGRAPTCVGSSPSSKSLPSLADATGIGGGGAGGDVCGRTAGMPVWLGFLFGSRP